MADQSASSNVSLIKKNPSGKFVGSGQRRMIINMYNDIKQNRPNLTYKEIINELWRQGGIGRMTIVKTISEYKKSGKIISPNKKKVRTTTFEKLTEEQKYKIRRTVHDFWLRRELPSLNNILHAVNKNPELPDFGRTTLYKILKTLNFEYTTEYTTYSRNSALLEQQHIAARRQNYLTSIQKYRNENRPIYYLDETWIDVGDQKKELRVDKTVNSIKVARREGLSTDTFGPTGKGKRLIVGHIASEDGFLPGGLLCFEAKKGSADYHEEISGGTFSEWFQRLLPMLKDRAVVVMDDAPYHCVKLETYPTMSWTKQDIIRWLMSKGQQIDLSVKKATLIDRVLDMQPRRDTYVVDKYAKSYDKVVLRLPPYHYELNPIELAWTTVKSYVKAHNTTCQLADVEELLLEAIQKVSAESWQNFFRHTKTEEKRMDDLDAIIDDILDSQKVNESGDSGSDFDSPSISIAQ